MIRKILSSKHTVMLVWIIGIIMIWEISAFYIAGVRKNPEFVLPYLHNIAKSVFSGNQVSSGQTALQIVMSSAFQTLSRAGIGFMAGMVIGYVLAILMRLSGIVEKTVYPYLMITQMIPILGMAPIILAITHDIEISRIAIAALLTFYPVCTNVLAGFKAVEEEKHDLMYLCAANKFQVYIKTLIPSSIPYFFTGLKISAPLAITASILVDTLQGEGGLGHMLSQSLKRNLSIYVFWQIVFFSAFVGIFSFHLMGMIEKLFMPHKRKTKFKERMISDE